MLIIINHYNSFLVSFVHFEIILYICYIDNRLQFFLFFQSKTVFQPHRGDFKKLFEVFSFFVAQTGSFSRDPHVTLSNNQIIIIMGSFRATLELGGKEFDVLYSNYEFSRSTDSKGKPASSISGGRVTVTVESTDDTTAIEAMLNSQFKAVDGKIVYKKTDEDAKMKEIDFRNAYIVHYKETLDVNNEVPMTISMTFSAENITVGNAELDNRWPRV